LLTSLVLLPLVLLVLVRLRLRLRLSQFHFCPLHLPHHRLLLA
jgi:hypothetical protein